MAVATGGREARPFLPRLCPPRPTPRLAHCQVVPHAPLTCNAPAGTTFRGRAGRGDTCKDPQCLWHTHLRTCGGEYVKIRSPDPKPTTAAAAAGSRKRAAPGGEAPAAAAAGAGAGGSSSGGGPSASASGASGRPGKRQAVPAAAGAPPPGVRPITSYFGGGQGQPVAASGSGGGEGGGPGRALAAVRGRAGPALHCTLPLGTLGAEGRGMAWHGRAWARATCCHLAFGSMARGGV